MITEVILPQYTVTRGSGIRYHYLSKFKGGNGRRYNLCKFKIRAYPNTNWTQDKEENNYFVFDRTLII